MPNQKPAVVGPAQIEPFAKPRYKRRLESKKHIAKDEPIKATYVCDVLFAANSVRRKIFLTLEEIGEWLENECKDDPISAVYIDAEIIYCHADLKVESERIRELLRITL